MFPASELVTLPKASTVLVKAVAQASAPTSWHRHQVSELTTAHVKGSRTPACHWSPQHSPERVPHRSQKRPVCD
eukprot:752632-Hanusia_phi.AAC.3